ncbi:MAG: hypothetical protein HY721_17360, partial [Planctomycetes bacterium]|nr:hypothetical protein [Planctomycetota bacterium]
MPEDATTLHVRRAKAGDRESLEWLVKRFTPLLIANARYRLARPLWSLYDPEDVVNDVWLVALPRLPDLPPREGRHTPVFLKFLSTTLLYRVNDLVAKHIRGKPGRAAAPAWDAGTDLRDPVDALPAPTTEAVRRLVRQEAREAVAAAIDELEEGDRSLVILRGIEG